MAKKKVAASKTPETGSKTKKKVVPKNNNGKTSQSAKSGKSAKGKASKKSAKKGEGSGKKKASPSSEKPLTRDKSKIIYPDLDVRLYSSDPSHGSDGPLTVEIAKEILGWTEESENIKFGKNYTLKLPDGSKIRCMNNLSNRPFYPQLALDWKLEILRGKWKLNGETMVIDRLGCIHEGQHRLIGLVLAEIERKGNLQKWTEFWKKECFIDAIIIVGISEADEVVNTLGTGKPRSLADVIYRSEFFQDIHQKERARIARVTSYAVKLVWFRTGADLVSYAPKRPHSESLEFIANHPTLLECVKHVYAEDAAKEKRISNFIQLGYAAGLLYLMASCASDSDSYNEVGTEEGIDWALKDKAFDFWVHFANKTEDVQLLQKHLVAIDNAGSLGRDQICGAVAKAWNLWSDGKKLTPKAIEVAMDTDEFERPIVAEQPRVGGIDIGEKTA